MKSNQLGRSFWLSACVLSTVALSVPSSTWAQGSSMQHNTRPAQSTNSSLSAVDRQFIQKAAQSDMTEIQTSQLALQRSRNPKVRDFANMMIQEHTQSSSKLKPLAAQKQVKLPTTLGTENSTLLSQLKAVSATGFDRAYMQGQLQAHTKTDTVYQQELQQGKDSDVKAFARQVEPVVAKHRQMASEILAGR